MSSEVNSSKAAIVINMILGKVSSILGYTIVIILGLPLVMGEYPDMSTVIVVLVLMAGGIALIINGIRIKRRIRRFKKYINLISVEGQTSLENIASSTSQSIDFVQKDIQKMIDKRFFVNASINKHTKEIVIPKRNLSPTNVQSVMDTSVEMIRVSCGSCGAVNSIGKGITSECEFCGSPVG